MPARALCFVVVTIAGLAPARAVADPVQFCGQPVDATTTKLECEDETIADLSPLAGATALEELELSGMSRVVDLSPLGGLTALTYLDVRLTGVTDLAPLAKLTNLRRLDVRGTAVRDLKPLAGLPLADLNISGTKVTDLRAIAGLKLARLSIAMTSITDLAPLATMVSLYELDASDTRVKKIRALAKHENLDQVDLRGSKVSKADAKWLGKRARHVYWGADGEGHFGTATRP